MIKLIKIPGEQNPSDVLTKYVKSEVINKFLEKLGIEYRTNVYNLSNIFMSMPIKTIIVKNDYQCAIKRIFKYMFHVVFIMLLLYLKVFVFIESIYGVDVTYVFTFKSTKHTLIDIKHNKHIN